MGASIYGDVSGASRKGKELYVKVNGVNRKIKKEYAKVNGVVRQVYSGAIGVTVSLDNINTNLNMTINLSIGQPFLHLYTPGDHVSGFTDLLDANFYFSSPIDFIIDSYAKLNDGFENYNNTKACLTELFYFYNSSGQVIYNTGNPYGSNSSFTMHLRNPLYNVTRIKISFKYQKNSYTGGSDEARVAFTIGGFPNTDEQFLYNGAEVNL